MVTIKALDEIRPEDLWRRSAPSLYSRRLAVEERSEAEAYRFREERQKMANENQIEVWAQLKVSAGQGEAFRAIAGQMIEAVDTQEPGCTRYHWFLTDGDSECSVSELYDDSAALLAHFRGTAIVDLAPNLFTVAELTRLEVHGSPSPEAAEAVAAFGTAILKAFSGINR